MSVTHRPELSPNFGGDWTESLTVNPHNCMMPFRHYLLAKITHSHSPRSGNIILQFQRCSDDGAKSSHVGALSGNCHCPKSHFASDTIGRTSVDDKSRRHIERYCQTFSPHTHTQKTRHSLTFFVRKQMRTTSSRTL